MLNRKFLWSVLLLTIVALSYAIYRDSSEHLRDKPGDATTMEMRTEEAGPPVISESDQQRIAYIGSVLDTLENQRARLPYYGELIRIYSEYSRYYEAAGYAEKRARATGFEDDLREAGNLYFEAARMDHNQELSGQAGKKAESMYLAALEHKPGNADLKTDLAVVYMSLLKPEKSYEMLEKVLKSNPEHIRANFNTGVLLHHMGNVDQSIRYFDRSLALAEDTGWEAVVRDYLDRHHNELFH